VATHVGGTPDVITSPDVGILTASDAESFTAAVADGLDRRWNRAAIAAAGRRRTWDAVADECLEALSQAAGRS
jgi:hypothetical protein